MASERKHDFKARVIHEIKQLFFMFFYLWLVCGLFVLNQTVILGERNITYVAVHGVALLNALVLAKVMLIAEDLRIGNRFAQRALIYPILYKAAVFSILFIVAYTLEKVIVGYFGGESASASLPYLGSNTLRGVACVWAILFVSLIPFFTIREIGRVIGARELWNLVFRRGTRVYTLTSTPQ
ncbi:MAG TPA: hypothetical protein VLX09_16365 [Stellaceae bacterium]|nr:hypothetical protein [Stellaceae bacterium]